MFQKEENLTLIKNVAEGQKANGFINFLSEQHNL